MTVKVILIFISFFAVIGAVKGHTWNENKKGFKISSDMFVRECAAEDLDGGDDEYVSWMGEIKIRQKISGELTRLRETEYVTQRNHARNL